MEAKTNLDKRSHPPSTAFFYGADALLIYFELINGW